MIITENFEVSHGKKSKWFDKSDDLARDELRRSH